MRPLAQAIHIILKNRHGEPYASDKVADLQGKSDGEILEWASINLDPRNQSAMFGAIGIDTNQDYRPAMLLRRMFDGARRLQIKQSSD